MSKRIVISHTDKFYGDFQAIKDVSLEIEKGEFFTLLGPSGCGKTTLLRMIAGFVTIEKGEIRFDDKIINQMPVYQRNIGMVFQSYAIFPHLTVEQNVAYGLKPRKISKSETKRRVDWALDLTQISEYRDRSPQQLSGGQQQRVALARAIVIEPDLLLMDEPLSNLDAKLRVTMRSNIRELQRKLGITTIYVTHDQEEALAVSDRIAVMNYGVVEQVGSPIEIYKKPVNTFVANFIGVSNFLEGEIKGNAVSILNSKPFAINNGNGFTGPVKVSIRPQDIELGQPEKGALEGTIKTATFLGDFINYEVQLDHGQLLEVNQYIHQDSLMRQSGETVSLHASNVRIFSMDGKEALV